MIMTMKSLTPLNKFKREACRHWKNKEAKIFLGNGIEIIILKTNKQSTVVFYLLSWLDH